MSKKISAFRRSPENQGNETQEPDLGAIDTFLNASAVVGVAQAATPSPAQPQPSALAPVPAPTPEPPTMPQSTPVGKDEEDAVYKAVTVRLNKRRYSGLKLLSVLTDKTMQQHLEELIDDLLERHQHQMQGYPPKR